jgi:hypothetical protein
VGSYAKKQKIQLICFQTLFLFFYYLCKAGCFFLKFTFDSALINFSSELIEIQFIDHQKKKRKKKKRDLD